jgi:hypothetical protein
MADSSPTHRSARCRRLVKSRLIAGVFLLVACGAGLRADSAEILACEPTVLFAKREPIAQIARLKWRAVEASAEAVVARVSVGGQVIETPLAGAAGFHEADILVPDIAAPAELQLEILAGARPIAELRRAWTPQRKWKIYLVKSSHEDIGYEDFIHRKQSQIANYIDMADEISRPRKQGNTTNTREDGYHYVMESLLFSRAYIEERGEAAWRKLVEEQLQSFHGLSLMGAPSGVHSHWMDYEELARMTYPARREMKDCFGLDLKTFMIVDNPSLSWSGAQALAAAGFKYVARWGQVWRSGENNNYARTKLPALFWWQAPDKVHRVLFGWRSSYALNFWYGQTSGGHLGPHYGLPGRWVDAYLQDIQSGRELGPYPYDAVVVPSYVDHEVPKFDKRQHVKWADEFAYPQIVQSNPDEFFGYIEEKYGNTVPTLSGDLNNFSADYSTIDPESQGWKRQAARLLPVAEGLSVLNSIVDPTEALRPARVERAYTRLFDYDEHSWPTVPQVNDQQLFNAAWGKHQEGARALADARSMFNDAADRFGRKIRTGAQPAVAVFNSLAHPRSGIVELPGEFAGLIDPRDGRPIACQIIGEGRSVAYVRDIPAFGFVRFDVAPSRGTVTAAPAAVSIAGNRIESPFYRLEIDPATGGVRSIVEKKSGRELVDSSAPHQVNQLVFLRTKDRTSPEGETHVPTNVVAVSGNPGAVYGDLVVQLDDAFSGAAIRQTIRVYADQPRIDFIDDLAHAGFFHTDNVAERYRNNLFVAFPFAVPGGQPRAEYAAGVVRPGIDQLSWGSHDYLTANRWVDVSSARNGVTLVPWNAATFHFGEIRYNRFSIDYTPTRPWLYSYAWSNRMAGLLTLSPEDCHATLAYSFTSHDGDWDRGDVVRFGWETASPLRAIALAANQRGAWPEPAKSFLGAREPNVQLSVLKASGQAGRGWVTRWIETSGHAADVTVDVAALGVNRAWQCDLVENDQHPLALDGGVVRARIEPFGQLTLRLEAGEAPRENPRPVAAATTDDSVTLRWDAVSPQSTFAVFRSEDPKAPPTVYSQVAVVRGGEFVDRGLNLEKTYVYRVAPLSAANLAGAVSAPLFVSTTRDAGAAPRPVTGSGVVRRSRTQLMPYWRRSPESDVAYYLVYRSTQADFAPGAENFLRRVARSGDFLETFRDDGLEPGTAYYYRVQVVDWAGNVQRESPLLSARTPR